MTEAEARSWVQKELTGWPKATQRLAVGLVVKYDAPAETGKRQIVWLNKGGFVRTVLLKEETPHDFPAPHQDVLEQTVGYAVPREKMAEIAQYNGSVIVDRTRGEVTSRADKEEANILALNLVDEIVRGERSVEQARAYAAQVARAWMIKEPEPYAQKLRFKPATNAGDRDVIAPLIKHMSEN